MNFRDILIRAVSKDIAQNPSNLYSLTRLTSKEEVQKFLLSDVLRELQDEPGPVSFPNVRRAVSDYFEEAKRIAGPSGLSQDDTKTDTKTDTSDGFDWGGFLGGAIETIGKIGVDVWKTRESLDLKKDMFEREHALLAEKEKAESDEALAAMRMKQAQLLQQQAALRQTEPAGDGLPGWVLPVGIGAAGLLVAVFLLRKRK